MSTDEQLSGRILVIDDNPAIHDDFRKILTPETDPLISDFERTDADFFGEPLDEKVPRFSFQLDSAFQGQEGLDKVREAVRENRRYSMAFVDMRMPPGWDGLTSIEEIWKIAPDLQVVICTAYSDNNWTEICERLGHSDGLLILKKPFDNIEVSQIAIALTKKWNLTQRAKLKQRDLEELVHRRTEQLQHAAQHDPLTNLPNRTMFHARLNSALKGSQQSGNSTALLLLDVDHFKDINDTLGHPVGDEVICSVAERLQGCIRKTDTVARLGGDEFAIIQTPISDENDATTLAKRVFEDIRRPFEINGKAIYTDMSIGIVLAPRDGDDPDCLLSNADLALYRSKADGRGCHRFFETEMDLRMKARREMELNLKDAVSNERFELHYQPMFVAATGKLCCFEALVRWRDPERGLIPPIEFIPVAEDMGLIIPLGEWVIKQACTDAANWPDDVRIAVNVSGVQFRSNLIVDAIADALSLANLNPNRLEIEITESALLRDCDETLAVLHAIRDLGARIVMDDFGTGYSSLSYLRSFPFDKLKIDKSFVQDLAVKEDAEAIVSAVAHLGKCLGMETTAEGVETELQLKKVVAEGYTQVQGFLYGRPVCADKINIEYFENKKTWIVPEATPVAECLPGSQAGS